MNIIAKKMGVSRYTVYNYIREARAKATMELINVADEIDRQVLVNVTGRGAIIDLYSAAREKMGKPYDEDSPWKQRASAAKER